MPRNVPLDCRVGHQAHKQMPFAHEYHTAPARSIANTNTANRQMVAVVVLRLALRQERQGTETTTTAAKLATNGSQYQGEPSATAIASLRTKSTTAYVSSPANRTAITLMMPNAAAHAARVFERSRGAVCSVASFGQWSWPA